MKHYTQQDIETVEDLMKATKSRVMYRKYLVIRLHMTGHSNLSIAEMTGLNKNTVWIYINAYNERGSEGLIPKKQTGRPKRLTDEQEKTLFETIKNKTPDEVGFSGIMNWTAKIAREWIRREFGVEYHINGVLEMFYRLNLSYTRPTYVLANADPQKQEQFRQDFEEGKKTPKRRH